MITSNTFAIISARIFKLLLGTLFLTTSIGKLLDTSGFAEVLGTYQLFPSTLLMPFALSISLSEFFLGLFIFSNRKAILCANIALGINFLYLVLAIATNLRGLHVPNCGCFGVFLARPMTWMTVVEDIIVVLISLAYVFILRKKTEQSRESFP